MPTSDVEPGFFDLNMPYKRAISNEVYSFEEVDEVLRSGCELILDEYLKDVSAMQG
jgi:hypothetical protein